jgi:hypothetical protein
MKYKVGDKVRVVECSTGTVFHKGKIGIYKGYSTEGQYYWVHFPNSKMDDCEALEIAPVKTTKPRKPTVKIPKCPKTLSGKHEFGSSTIKTCWTELKHNNNGNVTGFRDLCLPYRTKVKPKCIHCGLVNDLDIKV